MMKTILRRKAVAEGGREGTVRDAQGNMDLTLRKPAEMGGEDQPGTDPETLFAAGYASCLASSLEYLLKNQGQDYEDIRVDAEAGLAPEGDGGFAFTLDVTVHVAGVDRTVGESFAEKAVEFCPFSKAIRGNVDVRLNIE